MLFERCDELQDQSVDERTATKTAPARRHHDPAGSARRARAALRALPIMTRWPDVRRPDSRSRSRPAWAASTRRCSTRCRTLKLVVCNGAGLDAHRSRRGAGARHRGLPYAGRTRRGRGGGAIALTYAIMRRVAEADRFVRAGRWLKERMAPSRRVAGKTMGIVGLGRIGRRVAQRAEGDRHEGRSISAGGPQPDVPYPFVADLLELAAQADVLVLSCPGGEATRGLVDRAVLERLGPRRIPGQRLARLGGRRAGADRGAAERHDRRRGARRVRVASRTSIRAFSPSTMSCCSRIPPRSPTRRAPP